MWWALLAGCLLVSRAWSCGGVDESEALDAGLTVEPPLLAAALGGVPGEELVLDRGFAEGAGEWVAGDAEAAECAGDVVVEGAGDLPVRGHDRLGLRGGEPDEEESEVLDPLDIRDGLGTPRVQGQVERRDTVVRLEQLTSRGVARLPRGGSQETGRAAHAHT
jgi:hypothetical protein